MGHLTGSHLSISEEHGATVLSDSVNAVGSTTQMFSSSFCCKSSFAESVELEEKEQVSEASQTSQTSQTSNAGQKKFIHGSPPRTWLSQWR